MSRVLRPWSQCHIPDSVGEFLIIMTGLLQVELIVVTITGMVLIIRYGFSIKFWRNYAFCYAIYLLLSTIFIVSATILYDVFYLADVDMAVFVISGGIYPVIALLELMLMVVTARWINGFFVKKCNRV